LESNNLTITNIPEGPLSGVTFLITADQLGISQDEPGKKLMKNLIYSLSQLSAAPEAVILVNTGVKLAAKDSETLEDLLVIAERGTDIRLCGTCVNYYGLTDSLGTGTVSNMQEIVEILTSATRTITL
jgi:selenium metabolism protein YedF